MPRPRTRLLSGLAIFCCGSNDESAAIRGALSLQYGSDRREKVTRAPQTNGGCRCVLHQLQASPHASSAFVPGGQLDSCPRVRTHYPFDIHDVVRGFFERPETDSCVQVRPAFEFAKLLPLGAGDEFCTSWQCDF